jgi:hypothetical protein
MPSETHPISELTNHEFFERHAAAGRIGLVCGSSVVDRAITRAQRPLDLDSQGPGWSHAFLLQGRRKDGFHWVIESDLEIHRRHVRLGVQENRLTKFLKDSDYPRLAILDLGLNESQAEAVIGAALGLVADRTRYSIRELFGTLLAVRRPELRPQENRLSRKRSLFCSAFVQHCFRQVGIDLMPGVDTKNTTPNDLARSPVLQTLWVLDRPVEQPKLARTVQRIRTAARTLRRTESGTAD